MKQNQNIRITSGLYRGITLKSPNSLKTHPMGAREKLALFNILQPYLKNAAVLDLFAGSGALGIEALSRGANSATFVEKDKNALNTIKENLKILNLAEKSELIKSPVETFTTPKKFDIVLADPPYDIFNPDFLEKIPNFLKPAGIFALSSPNTPKEFKNLTLISEHTYARAHISIFTKNC